jgi:hypothetical protein
MMVAVLFRLKASGMLDEYPNLSAYVPAAKRGPPSSVLSTLNWRFSLASHRPADKGPLWVGLRQSVAKWPRPACMPDYHAN